MRGVATRSTKREGAMTAMAVAPSVIFFLLWPLSCHWENNCFFSMFLVGALLIWGHRFNSTRKSRASTQECNCKTLYGCCNKFCHYLCHGMTGTDVSHKNMKLASDNILSFKHDVLVHIQAELVAGWLVPLVQPDCECMYLGGWTMGSNTRDTRWTLTKVFVRVFQHFEC